MLLQAAKGGMTKVAIEEQVSGIASADVNSYRHRPFVSRDGVRFTDIDVRTFPHGPDGAPAFIVLEVEHDPCLPLKVFASQIGADEPTGEASHHNEPPGSGSLGYRRQVDGGGNVHVFSRGEPYACVTHMTATVRPNDPER